MADPILAVAQFEHAIADFLGGDAALVFPTGYTANLGLIAALTRPRVAVSRQRASVRDEVPVSATGVLVRAAQHQLRRATGDRPRKPKDPHPGLPGRGSSGGQGRDRTGDLPLFRRTLVPTELPGQQNGPVPLSWIRPGQRPRRDLNPRPPP